MPVILNQHFSAADRVYEDAEFSLYHFPKVYFSRVRQFDRFIYYRPLGESSPRPDSKHYFGHGVLGDVFDDPVRRDHRFVNIIRGERFETPVPLQDYRSNYYETEAMQPPIFQSSVREISETAYYKILAAGDASSAGLSFLPSTESIDDVERAIYQYPPRDRFRNIFEIPPGAGYVPKENAYLNVYEAAALQERARKDHQVVLRVLQREVLRRGGTTSFNNNVDLFAQVGSSRMLIEAKSVNNFRDAVNRMRYGIGQLADYAYRYESELAGATKVLAFPEPPRAEVSWIANVLSQERVAFVSASEVGIEALNDSARTLPLFD